MDARLQQMLDCHEISRVLAEYTHGCDRCDEPHMASTYWDDSWDDHGVDKAAGPEFARLMTARIKAETTSLSHLLGQSIINVDGDQAGAETWFIANCVGMGVDGAPSNNLLGGRYIDRFERRDNEWRIKHRVVVKDWAGSIPCDPDWSANGGLTPGRRDNADPSQAVLGVIHSIAAPAVSASR